MAAMPPDGRASEPTERLVDRLRRSQALAKLIGEDPTFVRMVTKLPSIAASDATVLVTGETGCGKELVARAIHYMSERAALPLVPVNCGALPDSLLEDELFGHERGAFTDARASRVGLIAEAEGGTLLLDEVSSLSARAQAVLLRVLQEKTYRPLGSSRERPVDVRFIAATNVPLEALVAHGTLRADLYYRLSVLTVQLPALRDRRGDVLLLARHFLALHTRAGMPAPELAPDAEAALLRYDWPGNVRELENAAIRGLSVAAGGTIVAADLGIPWHGSDDAGAIPVPLTFQQLKRQVVEAFEHDYLARLMAEHHGNVSRAARAAGKERRELGKLLKKHHLAARDS
jgi:two-component system, NtrC family, response regulator GlrR